MINLKKCNKANLKELEKDYGLDFLLKYFNNYLKVKKEIEEGINEVENDKVLGRFDIYLLNKGLLKKYI